MKIAITGALGHIGSYLVKSFPDDFSNYKFYLIDNFKTQRYTSLFNFPQILNINSMNMMLEMNKFPKLFKK